MTAAEWVSRACKRELSEFQARAVNLLCAAQGIGPYDFRSTWESAEWSYGKGCRFKLYPRALATYDFDGLTRLVIGAHEQCIRVEIEPVNMQLIAIVMHPRQRDGSMYERHPSIEQAVENYRSQQ